MSAKDILCTYFYTNNFNRFKVITLTISNYGETWGGYFKTNYMKLYTEEQVRKAIDMARDRDMEYTKYGIFDVLTPIELPSGLDTFKKIIEDRPTEFSQYNAHNLLFVIDLIQNGQEVPEQMELIKLIRKNK